MTSLKDKAREAAIQTLPCDGQGCPYKDGTHATGCPAYWRDDVIDALLAFAKEAMEEIAHRIDLQTDSSPYYCDALTDAAETIRAAARELEGK